MMRTTLLVIFTLCSSLYSQAQDEKEIRLIFDEALARGQSYAMLKTLTKDIGPRLSGSKGAEEAVQWSKKVMEAFGFDSVWLQPVMVPHWVRGKKEVGRIVPKKGPAIEVNVCALGGTIGTGKGGISANVVEVKSFEELAALGKDKVSGKIVFFNQPMDPTLLHTFSAYGKAGFQRYSGPSEAARYGAIGVVVRSLGSGIEDYPHTGAMNYAEDAPRIPAIAISTLHANKLSEMLRADDKVKFYFESYCETLPDVQSYNVVGELRGTEHPEEIIVVGGHLDSWDLGEGAHDDGSGCVQSIEVLRIFKAMGYKPRRTIRAVMFMNEENGLRGGREYARLAKENKENHIVAIESDRGGFTPRGFTSTATPEVLGKILSWKPLLEPYGLTDFSRKGGGADIGPLGEQGCLLMEYLPDSQRYFSYHHTPEDTFDKVNRRELELGAASMASIVYLIDQYGIK